MENSTTVGNQVNNEAGQAAEAAEQMPAAETAEQTPAAETLVAQRQIAESQAVTASSVTASSDAAQPVAAQTGTSQSITAPPARRRAAGAVGKGPAIAAGLGVLGFALEVAMLAAFVFWGFRQESPWDMVLGIGVPAIVVVLWGVFLAPRSERRLKPAAVLYVSTALFLLAALALFGAEAVVLGTLMAVFSIGNFVASGYLARQGR